MRSVASVLTNIAIRRVLSCMPDIEIRIHTISSRCSSSLASSSSSSCYHYRDLPSLTLILSHFYCLPYNQLLSSIKRRRRGDKTILSTIQCVYVNVCARAHFNNDNVPINQFDNIRTRQLFTGVKRSTLS